MGRIDRDNPYPISRDYALTISCEQIICPINKLKHCSMPSSIKIGSGGQCKTGKELIDLERIRQEEIKNKNKKDNKWNYNHDGD